MWLGQTYNWVEVLMAYVCAIGHIMVLHRIIYLLLQPMYVHAYT